MPSRESLDRRSLVPGGEFVAGAAKYPDDVSITPVAGDGAYLQTADGDEYLDYLLGGGPLVVGHSHPDVVEALQQQAMEGTTFFVANDAGLDLAERIVEASPCAERIKFTSSGSEATFFALRLARAYTGREKVLKFDGAYHGWHDGVMVSSSYADPGDLESVEYPDGTVDTAGASGPTAHETLVAPFNDARRTREIVAEHADELAAIIAEPIMRSIPPEEGFLEELRSLCDEHGIVLVFDEVVTGFRLAWGGAQEYYGVEPDLVVYGKAIGGGTPVAALCGRAEVMELSDPHRLGDDGAYVSGTLNGNALSAAAGLATLDVLGDGVAFEELNAYADEFRAVIDDVLEDSSLSGTALCEGPIVDYAITDADDVSRMETVRAADSKTKKAIDRELLREGILQMHGSKRYVSTAHGDRELHRTAEAFKTAVDRVD